MDLLEDVLVALFGPDAKPSIAEAVRDLVRRGLDNSEIWDIVQPQFGLSDDKRWYPGWYRAEMKRRAIS